MTANTRSKRSNDFTGRQAAELQAKTAAEQQEKAEQMAMMTAEKQQKFDEEVQDMTVNPAAPTIVDEVVEVGVTLSDNSIVVRVAEDVENMTYGHGNTYSFVAGGKYKVPKPVADRLEKLGLLYERL
jgi:hypothetical protein